MIEQVEHDAAGDVELLAEAARGCAALGAEMRRVVIGQDAIVEAMLAAVLCEGHVLLVGVPGLAKTLLVKTLGDALGWRFQRIQFTPDMMPADITGTELLQDDEAGGRHMRFVPGPVFANVVLADEINRTPPKTQAALLEAMQEHQVTSMGRRYPLERPFVVVATQNPIEQEGTYPLPEAQLDRFMFSLWMDYPAAADEQRIVMATTAAEDVTVTPVLTRERVLAYQQLVRRIPASPDVVSHAVAIARATRPEEAGDEDGFVKRYVAWGAGTRAAQYLVLAGKAKAVMGGEPTVTIDHLRAAAPHVLRHRVLPSYQAVGEGLSAAQIVEHVLANA